MRRSSIPLTLAAAALSLGIAPVSAADAPKADKHLQKKEPFSLEVVGETTGDAAPIVKRLKEVFEYSYPKLIARFDDPNRPAPRKVRLEMKPKLNVPAYASGGTISVSLEWLRQHPEDVGLLTHELTHVVQHYRGRKTPGWFTEGFADFTRKICGPVKQPGWELPEKLSPSQSYRDSYRVTGRFLLWLDARHPKVVDRLHRSAQNNEFNVADFKRYTNKTIDELWAECVRDLDRKK